MPITILTLPGLGLATKRPKTANLQIYLLSVSLVVSMKSHRPRVPGPQRSLPSYGGAGHRQHGIDFMNYEKTKFHVWALE